VLSDPVTHTIEESDALASLAIWRTLGQDGQTARRSG